MADEDDGNAQPGTSASTPNSTTAPGSGVKAAKDRKCPFCAQAFTSSSLGRHLDLYIKPKNPKPPDGVHDVVEIRKLRGGITRRQPRTGVRAAGSSIGNNDQHDSVKSNSATPSVAARRPTRTDYEHVLEDSPAASPGSPQEHSHRVNKNTTFNSANWQATGVINNLPPREPSRNAMRSENATATGQAQRVHDMRHDAGGNRFQRPEYENEGMWKLQEAAEMGRAAEMALREVLGSLEAAQKTVTPQSLYEDFDFFALNFPGLSLAILPAPSTLFSPTPFASAESWTLDPPTQRQFETIGRMLNERVALRRKTEHVSDALFFKYHAHLAGAWEHWKDISDQDRASAWNLEVLRAVSRGQDQNRQLRSRLEHSEQRVRHLETEYDRLSRCQLPREYLMHPPNTTAIPTNIMREVKPSEFKSEVATMGYDAEAILGKWRSTIRATTRRQKDLSTTSSLGSLPKQKPARTLNIQEDMMMNGAVWNVGGPMPRNRPAHASNDDLGEGTVSYETPPEPGVVVGADEEGPSPDVDADGETEDVSRQAYGGNDTALVRRGLGDLYYGASANGGSVMNVNGKRAMDSDALGGRSGGPKIYKEHVEGEQQAS